MDTIDTTSSAFHATFDSNVRELMDPVRTTLLESAESCTKEEIVGQLLMNLLNAGGFSPGATIAGRFNLPQKQRFIAIAEHLGPDWAQALYRAAVFITKVA